MTTTNEQTYASLTRQTDRIQLPVPSGAKRVRASVTGTWRNAPGKGDPMPASVELRTIGGLPHRGEDIYAKARHERSLQLTLTSDANFMLPPAVVGVVVDVKRHNPAFNVELVLTDAGHEEHGDQRSSTD